MKKITICLMVSLFMGSAIAQENDLKNFRFGLILQPSMNWLKPDNEKKFLSAGSGIGFGFGAQLEFRLNDNYSIVSGFGLRYDKGSLDFETATSADSVYYLLSKDESFLTPGSKLPVTTVDTSQYRLSSRKYNINYVNIPFALKMKTKEIGYIKYYGVFGADFGVKVKTRVNDQVYVNSSNNKTEVQDLNLDDGTQLLRIGLNLGAGIEYNMAGNTSIIAGINYHMAFTNSLKKEDNYLRKDNTGNLVTIEQKALARGIYLTVGVLF